MRAKELLMLLTVGQQMINIELHRNSGYTELFKSSSNV